jgi:hypothetical protein
MMRQYSRGDIKIHHHSTRPIYSVWYGYTVWYSMYSRYDVLYHNMVRQADSAWHILNASTATVCSLARPTNRHTQPRGQRRAVGPWRRISHELVRQNIRSYQRKQESRNRGNGRRLRVVRIFGFQVHTLRKQPRESCEFSS